jgi:rhomboid family GlyGly-CTERM serine protease
VAALGALLALAAPKGWLDWQPALGLVHPWRAVSAAWVHQSAQHLTMNLAGCALVALLGWRAYMAPRAVAAWALAWPMTHWGLWLQPTLQHYGGLSGVLHAAVAIIGCRLLAQHHEPRARAIGTLLAIGLVAKIVWEAPWSAALKTIEGWDFQLAPAAHASGAVAGVVAWALVGRQRDRARP